MTIKTLIVDPQNEFNVISEPELLEIEYNKDESNKFCPMSIKDHMDVTDQLLEDGFLVEMAQH